MSFRIPFNRVNWTTSAFLIGTFVIALVATPIYLYHFGLDLFQFTMFFFYLSATMMSITLGYHRLFSHLSFKAKSPVKLFTLIFGACAFENSALVWCADHRRHHKHVDHDEDPYDITKGFFWAHIGWLLFKLNPVPPLDNVNDLRKDKLVMWQDRWVHIIGLVVGLIIPPILAFAWYSKTGGGHGPWIGALGAFLLAGVLRVVVSQHCTFFINSLCHTVGRQPYSTKHTARDSAVMAFLTFGEGYHNYHHEFQHDYRNGVKRLSWDPTKWSIWLLSKVGLVSDLRRVSASKILLAEMTEAKRLADLQLARQAALQDCPIWQKSSAMLHTLYDDLAARYAELEQVVANRAELSRQVLHQWRQDTRELVRHLSKLSRISQAETPA